MMDIYGQKLSRGELLKRCNTDVLFNVRRVEMCSGRGKGQRLVELKTAAGLRACFSEDKCLDIVELEYKGINLAFLSKNGNILPYQASPETDGFVRYWQGGFLATCGLRNTGGSCVDNGESHPTHGRIGQTPADNVNIDVNENTITISGIMRETALFGHNLEMERKITVQPDGSAITVNDTIRNLTPEPEPVLLLYHINFGYPFLDDGLELEFPESDVKGRTEAAQRKISERLKITEPIDGEPEYVYFYSPKNKKNVKTELINKKLGLKASITYDGDKMPVLAQWKCMKSGDYALGIEPGTSYIRGRKEELENGYDVIIPGFRSLEYGFTVELSNI